MNDAFDFSLVVLVSSRYQVQPGNKGLEAQPPGCSYKN